MSGEDAEISGTDSHTGMPDSFDDAMSVDYNTTAGRYNGPYSPLDPHLLPTANILDVIEPCRGLDVDVILYIVLLLDRGTRAAFFAAFASRLGQGLGYAVVKHWKNIRIVGKPEKLALMF